MSAIEGTSKMSMRLVGHGKKSRIVNSATHHGPSGFDVVSDEVSDFMVSDFIQVLISFNKAYVAV